MEEIGVEMNSKIKNLGYAFLGNFLTLIMGVISGFLIPMFLNIYEYSNFKVFLFYLAYVGITHFGFIDGIYIKYGRYDYEDLPKKKFRKYFKMLLIMQLIEFAVLSILIKIYILDGDRYFILISILLNMIIVNITSLFSFIHQFTKRVKLFSINLVLTKLIFILGCLILFSLKIGQYEYFILIQTLANLIVLIIYILYNKELIFGKSENIFSDLNEYKDLFKMGLLVMIGNLMSQAIIGLDRFIIDRYFTIVDFSMYSFAYTLITLFYILLNAITMVIYPYLTRSKKEVLPKIYILIKDGLIILTSYMISGYFILDIIVRKILPQYVDSLSILMILIPTIILSAQTSILVSNMYKVFKLNRDYTKNNIIALAVGIITNIIALIFYRTTVSIAIATLISFIIWVFYSDRYFEKKLNITVLKSNMIQIGIIIIFYSCVYLLSPINGFLVYNMFISIILLIFYKNRIIEIVKIIKNK